MWKKRSPLKYGFHRLRGFLNALFEVSDWTARAAPLRNRSPGPLWVCARSGTAAWKWARLWRHTLAHLNEMFRQRRMPINDPRLVGRALLCSSRPLPLSPGWGGSVGSAPRPIYGHLPCKLTRAPKDNTNTKKTLQTSKTNPVELFTGTVLVI